MNQRKKIPQSFQKIGGSNNVDKDFIKRYPGIYRSLNALKSFIQIKNKIIYGLNKIEKEISKNRFEFNYKYEDIHMNMKKLFQIIGEDAGYIHTADQEMIR